MIDHIRKETGKDIKHVLWLASKESVIENYEGTEHNIEEYETSSVILSDLGEEGILFGYVGKPVSITYPNEEKLIDIISIRTKIDRMIEKSAEREVQGEILDALANASDILVKAEKNLVSIIRGNNPFA